MNRIIMRSRMVLQILLERLVRTCSSALAKIHEDRLAVLGVGSDILKNARAVEVVAKFEWVKGMSFR